MADIADVKDYVFDMEAVRHGGGATYANRAQDSRERWMLDRAHDLMTEHPHWTRDQVRDQAERDFEDAVRDVIAEGP